MQININVNNGLRTLGYDIQIMCLRFNGVTRIKTSITITETLHKDHGTHNLINIHGNEINETNALKGHTN